MTSDQIAAGGTGGRPGACKADSVALSFGVLVAAYRRVAGHRLGDVLDGLEAVRVRQVRSWSPATAATIVRSKRLVLGMGVLTDVGPCEVRLYAVNAGAGLWLKSWWGPEVHVVVADAGHLALRSRNGRRSVVPYDAGVERLPRHVCDRGGRPLVAPPPRVQSARGRLRLVPTDDQVKELDQLERHGGGPLP